MKLKMKANPNFSNSHNSHNSKPMKSISPGMNKISEMLKSHNSKSLKMK